MIIKRILGGILTIFLLLGGLAAMPTPAVAAVSTTASSAVAAATPSGCPTSGNGAGNELLTGKTLDVIRGEYRDNIQVASMDASEDTEIVCVKTARRGSHAELNSDGTVFYVTAKKNDIITIGATNGNEYYSTTIAVSVEKVKDVTFEVLKKNKKRAVVKFTNPNKKRMLEIWAGTYSQPEPDIIFQLQAGESNRYITRRNQLDWSTAAYTAEGEIMFISNNSHRFRGKPVYGKSLAGNPSENPWS